MEERRQWELQDHATAMERLQARRAFEIEDQSTALSRLHQRRAWETQDWVTQTKRLKRRRGEAQADMERELERQELRTEWFEEDAEREREQYEERYELQEAQHASAVAAMEAQYALQEQMVELERSKWDADFSAEGSQLTAAMKHQEVLRSILLIQAGITQAQKVQIDAWEELWEKGGIFDGAITSVVNRLKSMIRTVSNFMPLWMR